MSAEIAIKNIAVFIYFAQDREKFVRKPEGDEKINSDISDY